MTSEFQEHLLKYLFQEKEAKDYYKLLDKTIFDAPQAQEVFGLWMEYVKHYKTIPSKPNFLEYFEREWQSLPASKATAEIKTMLLNEIAAVYSPLTGDIVFIREMIIDFAQKKLTTRLFTKNADKIANGSPKFFRSVLATMQKIVALGEENEEAQANRGMFYIADTDKPKPVKQKRTVYPTPWKAWNNMTSAKGFYAPQLIVILKGPKAYVTGIFLKMAAKAMIRGEKVFYADTENGLTDIYLRLDIAFMEVIAEELNEPANEIALKRIKALVAKVGGEFKAHYFPGGQATMDDVDTELTDLRDNHNYKPTVMFNDYLDKFVPADKSIKEQRLKIDNVYEHQMRLNVKYNFRCFTVSPIPITVDSVGKPYYTINDFGASRQKAYNCHGSFAVCCTDEELKNGTMRIIPVVQRHGVPFLYNAETTCSLKVDRATGVIEELDSTVYLGLMGIDYNGTDTKKKGRLVDMKKITDE